MKRIYSPESFSDDVNLSSSDQSNACEVKRKRTNKNSTNEKNTDEAKKRAEQHRLIEDNARKVRKKYLEELSSLITNWYDTKSSKLSTLALLQIAAELLNQIDLRYQNNALLPSYLTKDEVNFLNLEGNHTFLFVTTMDSSIFRITHVTDSIYRILHLTSEQWLDHDLFSFIHPNDLLEVQSKLLSLNQQVNRKVSIKCRLQRGNNSYSSVIIDGMVKKIDHCLKPVSADERGYLAFIGVCYFPLINEYNEKNMRLYQNPQSLIFSCRCSLNDWKIFLVDRSITTLPFVSADEYRNKSILDFIHIDDQLNFCQTLTNASLTLKNDLTACNFISSPTDLLTMIVDIKPFCNPSSQQTGFIELTFKNITGLINNSEEN